MRTRVPVPTAAKQRPHHEAMQFVGDGCQEAEVSTFQDARARHSSDVTRTRGPGFVTYFLGIRISIAVTGWSDPSIFSVGSVGSLPWVLFTWQFSKGQVPTSHKMSAAVFASQLVADKAAAPWNVFACELVSGGLSQPHRDRDASLQQTLKNVLEAPHTES